MGVEEKYVGEGAAKNAFPYAIPPPLPNDRLDPPLYKALRSK